MYDTQTFLIANEQGIQFAVGVRPECLDSEMEKLKLRYPDQRLVAHEWTKSSIKAERPANTVPDIEAEVFIKRMAVHAPRHMAQPWPKNIISVLCQEVMRLRAAVTELQRQNKSQP